MNSPNAELYLPGMPEAALREWLAGVGEKPFRARQIADWLYGQCEFDPARMVNLPAGLREKLTIAFGTPRSQVSERAAGSGNTTKLLLKLDDGEAIEMVLIPSPERMTFCLSTQVGCPVRCVFCASGANGLTRNLRSDEMLEEFYHGVREHGGVRPDNLVFMGIGEGLLNWKNLQRTLETLAAPPPVGFGFSPRRITVSTSGYVPGMRDFAAWGKPFNLALSLHATDDATRARLIPDGLRYPLSEVLAACEACAAATNRMPTFEYTLVAGINDDPAMGRELGKLARKMHAKINLIACNPVGEVYRRPGPKRLAEFQQAAEEFGTSVTMRVEKGSSAASACGQLRAQRLSDAPAAE